MSSATAEIYDPLNELEEYEEPVFHYVREFRATNKDNILKIILAYWLYYILVFPKALELYRKLKMANDILISYRNNPIENEDRINSMKSRKKEVKNEILSIEKNMSGFPRHTPFLKKHLFLINGLTKNVDNICRIDVETFREAGTMVTNREIVSKPYPMLITMTVYSIAILALVLLMFNKIIPVISGIVGIILLISCFTTAVKDFKLWKRKYC